MRFVLGLYYIMARIIVGELIKSNYTNARLVRKLHGSIYLSVILWYFIGYKSLLMQLHLDKKNNCFPTYNRSHSVKKLPMMKYFSTWSPSAQWLHVNDSTLRLSLGANVSHPWWWFMTMVHELQLETTCIQAGLHVKCMIYLRNETSFKYFITIRVRM